MAVSVQEDMWSRIPIIVILGATGSGKSKLGIELAKKFNGEIISADSMQVYKGLDIVTAKVTPEERALAPHHMIDLVDPLRRFNVVDFRNLALAEIGRIHSRGHLPVIVGGTNYYIESLLWKVLVEPEVENSTTSGPEDMELLWERDPQRRPKPSSCEDSVKRSSSEIGPDTKRICSQISVVDHQVSRVSDSESDPSVLPVCTGSVLPVESTGSVLPVECTGEDWDVMTNAQLHARLSTVDPDMAATLHPNNRRKIIRSLQVWYQEGRPLSSVLKEQRALAGGSSLGGPLRFPRSAILWIQCDQATLDTRLDARVDSMLEQGLLRELRDFHERYNRERLAANLSADYTAGIFQSIGLKEFHPLLTAPQEAPPRLLQEGVEALKLATRRYARRQIRWVGTRFLSTPDRQVPPVYGLDGSDVSLWDEKVLGPATRVVTALQSGEDLLDPPPLPHREVAPHETCSERCEACDRVFVDLSQWRQHLSSKKHKRQLAKLRARSKD